MITPARLKNISLFSLFKEEELKEFSRVVIKKRAKGGDVIFKEGEKGISMFVVIRGKVAIEKMSALDEEMSISTILCKEGDFFGEMAIFSRGSIRLSRARAITNAELIEIKRRDVMNLLKEYPVTAATFFLELINVISLRVGHTNRELVAFYELGRIMGDTAKDRDAGFLLQGLLAIAIKTLSARRGIVFTINFITGQLEATASRGFKKGAKIGPLSLERGLGILEPVVRKGENVILSYPDGMEFQAAGVDFYNILAVPLGQAGRVTGAVCIIDCLKERCAGFNENDLNIVTLLVNQVIPLMENIELRREEENRERVKREYFRF